MTVNPNPARAGRARLGPRGRRAAAALGVGALLLGSVYGLGPGAATASSHREAPLVAADPAIDNTDLYAFVSPERPGYVTFIANWQPFEEPNGGPNFYPFATDATYHIKVDNDGDAKPDAEFRWKFKSIDKRGGNTFLYNNGPVTSLDDENLLFRQTYTLESSFNGEPFKTRVQDVPVAPSRVGPASMPDYGKLRYAGDPYPARRLEDLRRPGGRPVLPGPAGLRPALRRRPERDRAGHPARLQRQHHRVAGAVQGRGPEGGRRSQPGDRHLDHHRAGPDPGHRRLLVRRQGAGVPAGQPAGQRGGRPGRPQGRLQRAPAGPGRQDPGRGQAGHRPRGAEADREDLRDTRPGDAAQRPRRDLPDRHHHQGRRSDQGRPQLAAQQRRRASRPVHAVGDAAAEPVGAGHRPAEPARRARRRPAGLPERPAADRRRRRHRAAGARGRRADRQAGRRARGRRQGGRQRQRSSATGSRTWRCPTASR